MTIPQGAIQEIRGRTVRRGNRTITIKYAWRYLHNGSKHHYIHVCEGMARKPKRRWSWITQEGES